MATTALYTAAVCRERIEAIDARLEELEGLPSSAGAGGQYVAFGQKASELRASRRLWLRRLASLDTGAGLRLPRRTV